MLRATIFSEEMLASIFCKSFTCFHDMENFELSVLNPFYQIITMMMTTTCLIYCAIEIYCVSKIEAIYFLTFNDEWWNSDYSAHNMKVFADHCTARNPVMVPREEIWRLRRRLVYFGSTVSSILKGKFFSCKLLYSWGCLLCTWTDITFPIFRSANRRNTALLLERYKYKTWFSFFKGNFSMQLLW
jgi:RRM in Demeter